MKSDVGDVSASNVMSMYPIVSEVFLLKSQMSLEEKSGQHKG